MNRFGLALTAAAALFAAPLAVSAAPAAPKAEAPKPYDKESLAKGAKEGPAVLAKSGLRCTSTGIAFSGQGSEKDPTTKKDVKQNVYEVSCSEGLGYSIIETAGAGTIKTYDCLTLAEAPNSQVKCKLPGNLDAKAQLQPLVTATGRTCAVTGGRPIGATKEGDAFFEVSCQAGQGYVITTTAKAAPTAQECAATVGGTLECKLTSKEQILAAQKAKLDTLIAKSGRTCGVSNSRTVGRLSNGEDLYEVACGTTGGFMLTARPDGSNVKATDCGKASGLAGGCELTNSAVAQTQESATYTRLAKAAGFDCNVSKYDYRGLTPEKQEVVELACGNRPDGGIALFPSDNSRGVVYDCVASGTLGQRCQLSDPSAVYNKYSQSLAAKGKTSCKVSSARWIGRYEKEKTDLIETGCADGQPGWVVELANNQIKSLLSCGQAKSAGVPCQLPGNTK